MATHTVPFYHGTLRLRKSDSLIGLRGPRALVPDLGGFAVVRVPDRTAESGLDAARTRPDVAVGTHVYFAPGDDRPVVPTGIIFCRLAPGVGVGESDALFAALHLEVRERRDDGTVVLSVTDRSRNPLHVAETLHRLAMVEEAVPDLDVPLEQYFTAPRDGLYAEQWALYNTGHVPGVPDYRLRAGADARVPDAWAALDGFGDPPLTVAVVDNGFDLDHPDLAGKAVHPLEVATGAATLPRGAAAGTHGTPCASLAVAAANGTGIVGTAPACRLMPLHGLTYSAYLTGRIFDHCIRHGAAVVSCSWGTVDDRYRPGPEHARALRRAATEGRGGRGCVVIFAAGNEGRDYLNYYCDLPGVIAVGACTSNATHPGYSNRGAGLSVVAPSDGGWPLLAARAAWDPGSRAQPAGKRYYVDGRDRGPYHKHFGGTSGAAPLVAGICALILTADPTLTAAEVKRILEHTADKIGGPGEYDARGYSRRFGYGRVNAARAVAEALGRRPRAEPVAAATDGYGLQVSALRDAASARSLADRLRAALDLPVRVAVSDGVHKVVVGTFADADAARAELPRLRGLGYQPFVRDLSTLS